jgi:hypothetical protein
MKKGLDHLDHFPGSQRPLKTTDLTGPAWHIRPTVRQLEELAGEAQRRGIATGWIGLVQNDFEARVTLACTTNDGTTVKFTLEFATEQAALMFRLKY